MGTVFKYLRAVRKELNLVMSEIISISSIKLELKTEHKKNQKFLIYFFSSLSSSGE